MLYFCWILFKRTHHIAKLATCHEEKEPNRILADSQVLKPYKYPGLYKRILVLYTGGTIGMVKGEKGLENKRGFFAEEVKKHKMLYDKDGTETLLKDLMNTKETKDVKTLSEHNHYYALPLYKNKRCYYYIYEFPNLLDSSNMGMEDWILISKYIEKNYKDFDGFVIIHGTDTMAYTASALSFIFENLKKPVVLTGSQIPIVEGVTDGVENFQSALIFAAFYNIPEVAVCFNRKLFRGNRTAKKDCSGLDAYHSPNYPPLAELSSGKNGTLRDMSPLAQEEDLKIYTKLNKEIGLLKLYPGISKETINAYLKMQGLVVETYGAGNAPENVSELLNQKNDKNRNNLSGVIILNTTQCTSGSVSDSYAVAFKGENVIAGSDMTPEAALTKLAYVLGKKDKDQWKTDLKKDLRGEMTCQTE